MRIMMVGPASAEIGAAWEMALANGATVRHAESTRRALDQLRAGQGADLLLLDARDDIAGTARALAAERFHLPIVAYGINADAATAVAAIKAGAAEFLPLPPDAEVIAAILETLSQDPSDLVFEDHATRQLLAFAKQVAPSDASILVTGESGTGKEMIARYVHRHSRRARQSFVSVNCAAIPDNLLESELFGHEKGAFTGALARRIGKFEEADGGTLLLDEISEMDPRLQAKLLRAIQEREIDRLGGTRSVRVDIRVIATSNRDLAAEVAAGRFREDLFFRLNVVGLHLLPLRRRPHDIAPLARHFGSKYARANGMPNRPLSDAALARLLQAPWKGNVRELENCMHRAVLLARGDTIEADVIQLHGGPPPAAEAGERGLAGQTVADMERSLILDTLHHTLGNRTHAAQLLGISIRTLRNKLRQYGDEGIAVPPPPSAAPLPELSESA